MKNKVRDLNLELYRIVVMLTIVAQWLWKDTPNVAGQYFIAIFILHSILSVLGIYIICTMIDQLWIFLFERPLFNWLKKQHIYDKWLNH